ncbi:phospholipase d1 protein [Rutstroemia sp. NJR-2017a BBW]|nr:phospholipase d1 protein [Rutstroemia sp. NJR-2017a BBW]
MENQFFITSCETMNVKIVNKIGDAIVERAIRAYRNGESWRCVILIPLMPGFQNTVDEPEGTSIRLIMQCQFRSICRGEGSIFGRLRTAGIEPEEYVQFYSLRSWGRIGPKKMVVTEQLYIHAKVIIVDDRIALIGSANINERSMLGNRDSEAAAVVRDTDMLWSTMDGKPYLVGRFAHELRMRLMREHLGLDVDEVMEEEKRNEMDREEEEFRSKMDDVYDESEESDNEPSASNDVTNPRVLQSRR